VIKSSPPLLAGAGSVLEGINQTKSLLSHDRLTIDPSCEDLAWEMENYSWKLDKNDNALDEPVKEDDDACDMVRYGVIMVVGPNKYVFRVRAASTSVCR
jgi:phage terminase large subunit